MRLYLDANTNFTNKDGLSIDFIEVQLKNGETISLNWDESDSHQERIEGRYARKGYRQLLVDNYIVIFRIDEINKTVHVVTVQYQRRNI